MRTERAGLSRDAAMAKAIDCMLKRWDGFARFLADVLSRIPDLPQTQLHELLPQHCKAERQQALAASASRAAGPGQARARDRAFSKSRVRRCALPDRPQGRG